MENSDFAVQRRQMVDQQLVARGIKQPELLAAMGEVPRQKFVGDAYRSRAYSDRPLPIGQGQTISQPHMVAMMTEVLQVGPDDKVLEIGAGSGYAAAVLSRLADQVYTVERHQALADNARRRLQELGYDNVEVLCGDGSAGWADYAPYDAIISAAAGPSVPDALQDQLAAGGRLVIPVGERVGVQRLLRIRRVGEDGQFRRQNLGAVRFVPLIGRDGFSEHGHRRGRST